VIGGALTFRSAFGQFAQVESANIRLGAIIQSNGRDVAATTAAYGAFTEQMMRTTNLSRVQITQLLGTAEAFNLTGKAAQDAVHNAEALTAVIGGSAEHYLRFTAALAKGDLETAMHMKRFIGPLREVRDATELAEKAAHLFESGVAAMEAHVNSASGRIERLTRDFNELMREVGQFVAEAVKPAVEGLSSLVQWFRDLSDQQKRSIVIMAGAVTAFVALGSALRILSLLGFAALSPFAVLVAAAGAAVAIFVERVGGITEAMNQARVAIISFYQANEAMIKTLGIAAGVLGGLIVSFKILQALQIIAIIKWALHTAAVVAWTAVMVTAKVTVILFSSAVTAASIALGALQTAFVFLYSLIEAIVTAGFGLIGIVVAVGVAIAGVTAIVYATVAVINLALAGVASIAAAGLALWNVLGLLVSGFANLRASLSSGWIAQVSGMFREWGSILWEVAAAATESFDIAWRMLQAGFALAMSQIRDQWAVIWPWIVRGFETIAPILANVFSYALEIVINRGKAAFEEAMGHTERAFHFRLIADNLTAELNTQLNAMTSAVSTWAASLDEAVESATTRAARDELNAIRDELQEMIDDREWAEILQSLEHAASNDVAKAFARATDKVNETKNAIEEVKAALVGSVQAEVDFAKYLEGARESQGGPRGGPVAEEERGRLTTNRYSPFRPDVVSPYTPFRPPDSAAAASGGTEATDILRQIRDFIAQVADRPPVVIGTAEGGL
jgi:hypothetical protein